VGGKTPVANGFLFRWDFQKLQNFLTTKKLTRKDTIKIQGDENNKKKQTNTQ
jgi:hypothetical protein